jgi:hypothetical protein
MTLVYGQLCSIVQVLLQPKNKNDFFVGKKNIKVKSFFFKPLAWFK